MRQSKTIENCGSPIELVKCGLALTRNGERLKPRLVAEAVRMGASSFGIVGDKRKLIRDGETWHITRMASSPEELEKKAAEAEAAGSKRVASRLRTLAKKAGGGGKPPGPADYDDYDYDDSEVPLARADRGVSPETQAMLIASGADRGQPDDYDDYDYDDSEVPLARADRGAAEAKKPLGPADYDEYGDYEEPEDDDEDYDYGDDDY